MPERLHLKKLAVSKPGWRDRKNITLYIPIRNQIRVTDEEFDPSSHWGYFARLAQRSKIYSAANLTHHYSEELRYALSALDGAHRELVAFQSAADKFFEKVEGFTNEVAQLDIWRKTDNEWDMIGVHRQTLKELRDRTANLKPELRTLPSPPESLKDFNFFLGRVDFLSSIFRTLSLLGREYEEVARLERLPGQDPFTL